MAEVMRFAKKDPEAFQAILNVSGGEFADDTIDIARGYQQWQQVFIRGDLFWSL